MLLLMPRLHAEEDEIRIGNTMAYSGPASAYGVIGRTIAAYFKKVNDEGGVNGRKIKFISYDDQYDPRKTVEYTKTLIEQDRALLIFAGLGTATSAAVRPYLNAQKVPQLFLASGASIWDQPRDFPWTMGFSPSYQTEAHIVAQYLLETQPKGKIAILSQDDEFGKDYLKGLKDGLEGKIAIVAEATYKVSDTDINQQIAALKASGADIFFDVTTPKFAVMAIRRTAELGWKPQHIITSVSSPVTAVMKPAGLENAEGTLAAGYAWEGDDPAFASQPEYPDWSAFMDRYLPDVSRSNSLATYGYAIATAMVEVLKRCGNDLSRENVMKQASTLKGLQLPMMIPGVLVNTSATDHAPLEQMQMMRFTGGHWQRFGPVRSGIDPGAVSDSLKVIFRYSNDAKHALADQLNANTVTLMTGALGSTYVQMGSDIAYVLDKGTDLRVLPVLGRGSVQAVADILLLRGVDVGIVRKDTLQYLERKGFASNIRGQLVYVTKMFNEEMHVLASKSINDLKELDGKTVAIDLPDGGTFVTSINVFERIGIKPHLLYLDPKIALAMLQKGDIDAIVAVEGKPLRWLTEVSDPNLHLVPVEYDKSLHDDYLPAQLSSDDYPNLVPSGAPVETIAGEAILASFNWRPDSDRYRRVSLMVDALFSHVTQLQRPPFHPKWLELAPAAPVAGWTRFKAAQEWIDHNVKPAVSQQPDAPAAAEAKDQKKEESPLLRQFRDWQSSRASQQTPPAADEGSHETAPAAARERPHRPRPAAANDRSHQPAAAAAAKRAHKPGEPGSQKRKPRPVVER
ncbi:ABC transporter substrate-binding protein [Bradyrhizobium sp.]|uniref:ABC transporter substrate-binding protein n=1 Tax=Bradyrhizobium sp. TaxID=376 RepID=UPI0025BAAA7F|nr:ABC transporter substrate-binding protein [Bradyrhizobium sp.]